MAAVTTLIAIFATFAGIFVCAPGASHREEMACLVRLIRLSATMRILGAPLGTFTKISYL
jgi:hypothetical protein